MPTKAAVKPWETLSDQEKREAIALRLGWKKRIEPLGVYTPEPEGYIELPDWPTNDGLAFTEVWPKILEEKPMAQLSILEASLSVSEQEGVIFWSYEGDTWADAICAAAYSLLEPANG